MRWPPGLLGARHPRAAVVAERRHHFDLIQRQRAFRIVDETLAGRTDQDRLIALRFGTALCACRPTLWEML
jgi:hypothetical protein